MESNHLSDDQKKTIEENKRKALEKLKKRQNLNNNLPFSNTQAKKPEIPINKTKVSIILENTTEFRLEFTFNPKIIDVCKSFTSRKYDMKRRVWIFPLNIFKQIVSKLKSLPNITVDHFPSSYIEKFIQVSNLKIPDQTQVLEKIDSKIAQNLLSFQVESLLFAIKNEGRILLADDMGLGKTLQALSIANFYQNEWPLVIITPASLVHTWKENIIEWMPSIPETDINLILSKKNFQNIGPISIISYDQFVKFSNLKPPINFKILIADECHFIKNPKSARSKSVLNLCMNAKRVIMISGTPALSKPIELFPVFRVICPNLFNSMFQFGLRYCDAKQGKFSWDYSGTSNCDELKIILNSFILIRRLKADVLHNLPLKLRKIIFLDPLYVDFQFLKDTKKEIELETGVKTNLDSLLLRYYQLTGQAKIKAVVHYLEDYIESDLKTIIFAHHQCMILGLCKFMEDKNLKYIKVDGSTSMKVRETLYSEFQENSQVKYAILSIKSSCSGLTMTNSKSVIFTELFWNPGLLLQAEDRIHRLGQSSNVSILYLIARGTSDDRLWPLIKKKLQVLNKVGLNSNNIAEGIQFEM